MSVLLIDMLTRACVHHTKTYSTPPVDTDRHTHNTHKQPKPAMLITDMLEHAHNMGVMMTIPVNYNKLQTRLY